MRDVIVVGGGPAGSAAALRLAGQGWDVLLLDRAHFPRDKPCGEFLTPATRAQFQDLGVWSAAVRNGLVEVPAMKLVAPSGRSAEYRPDSEPAGYALRRLVLDKLLLDAARQAGVEVLEGAVVRRLVNREDSVAGVMVKRRDREEEALSARIVIGADGTHSIVARELGVVRPIPRLQRVAVVSHWTGLGGDAQIEMRSADGLVCGIGSLGGDTSNVTVVARTDEAAKIAGRPADYLVQEISSRFPDLSARLEGAHCRPGVRTTGCFGHWTKRAFSAGALLVGDAAAFVDPFTGEGVYIALRGAELAAEAAHEALRSGDVSASSLSLYARRRKELAQRYLLCAAVQTVVRTPQLMERVVRQCGREPLTLDRLMKSLGDLAPASRVLQPAFAAHLFR